MGKLSFFYPPYDSGISKDPDLILPEFCCKKSVLLFGKS
jgi:hypothetical protein